MIILKVGFHSLSNGQIFNSDDFSGEVFALDYFDETNDGFSDRISGIVDLFEPDKEAAIAFSQESAYRKLKKTNNNKPNQKKYRGTIWQTQLIPSSATIRVDDITDTSLDLSFEINGDDLGASKVLLTTTKNSSTYSYSSLDLASGPVSGTIHVDLLNRFPD